MAARTLVASATTGVCLAALIVGIARGALPGEQPASPVTTEDPRPAAAAPPGRQSRFEAGPLAGPGAPGVTAAQPSATIPAPVVPDARPRLHTDAESPWPGRPSPPSGQRLTEDDAVALAKLARELLIADTTGVGRERFPGVWDGHPPRPCCRRVDVHDASAGRHLGYPDAALVLVTWSGVDHHGQPIHMTVTPLAFIQMSETGGWQPLPPWRTEGTTGRRHGGRHGGPYGGRQRGRHRRRHGRRHRARQAPEVAVGNAAGQRLGSGPRGDRHLLSARRRRSEPKALPAAATGLTRCRQPAPSWGLNRTAAAAHVGMWWATAVIAPATAGALEDRAADVLKRLAALAETIAALATLRTLLLVAVTLAALAAAGIALRRLATRRALCPDRRIRLVALPTDTFDPTPEEVVRYAAQLARVRRTVRGRLDRPAHAIRLRLDSVPGGGCVYLIEGSAQAASILRLTGYAEVDLRPAGASPPERGDHVTTSPDGPDDPNASSTAAEHDMEGTYHHPARGEPSIATVAARDVQGTRHHPTSEEAST